MGKVVSFEAVAHRRLPIEGLTIQPHLFGATHTFDFEGRTVTLRLPQPIPGQAERHDGPLQKRSSMVADPENPDTTFYEVSELEIELAMGSTFQCDEEVFQRPPVAFDFFTEKQRHENTELIYKLDDIITRAFWYWQSILRWIVKDHLVGRPTYDRKYPFSGVGHTRILRVSDRKTFWTTGGIYHVPAERAVTRRAWRLAQDALANCEETPIWFENLFEAHHRLEVGDRAGSVLASAIACETIIRSIFWLSFPAPPADAAMRLIDRTSVQAILNKWDDFDPAPNRESIGPINQLFELRNRLVHDGKVPSKDLGRIGKLLGSVTTFIVSSDERYRQRRGLPNRTARSIRHGDRETKADRDLP